MLIQYSPNPQCYVVMRIDHLATVEHFPCPDIIEAAKKVQPKKYLVYLDNALSIPFPQDPWFPFRVIPIAPFPPAAEGRFTPEMCIPIYPNTRHPGGRTPVRTELPFPYDNCYHWSNSRIVNVRVRPRQDGYFDDDIAVRVTIRGERDLWGMVAMDRTTVAEADAPEEESRSAESLRQDAPQTLIVAPEAEGEDLELGQDEALGYNGADVDAQGCASGGDAISQFEALVGMGVFGTRLDNKDDYPLVDVWLELTDHLKQENIPDPRDFYAECDTLVRLVKDAQRRLDEEQRSSNHGSYPSDRSEGAVERSVGDDPVKTAGELDEKRTR